MAKGPSITIRSFFDSTGVTAAVNSINRLNSEVNRVAGGFNKFMGLLGGAAFGASIISFAKSSINAFIEEERAVAKLQKAMANLGITSEKALQENLDFAKSLQNVTGVTDDTIVGVQALLSGFGLYGAELQKATKATLDLATFMGDASPAGLAAAAKLLGKAFAGETSMLKRYGVIIADNIPKTEKYAAVIDAVTTKFGGMAEAMGKTTAGKIEILTAKFDDLKETIGESLMPSANLFIGWLQKAFDWTEKLSNKLTALSPSQIAVIGFQKAYTKAVDEGNKADAERYGKLLEAAKANMVADVARLKTQRAEQEKNVKPAGVFSGANQGALDKFDAEMKTDTGAKYLAFFGAVRIESERTAIARIQDSKAAASAESAALLRLKTDYANASKTFSGGFKQAFYEVGQAGTNWNANAQGMMSSFTSNFASGFKEAALTAEGFFDFIDKGVKALFESILNAFAELMAQMVAKAALYGIINLITGGMGGGLLKFLGFAQGGMVPGAKGRATAAVVHGGEYVLPAAVVDAIKAGRATPSAALSAAGIGAGGGASINQTLNITVAGGIASNMDAQRVAQQISEAARRGITWAVESAKINYKVGQNKTGETAL